MQNVIFVDIHCFFEACIVHGDSEAGKCLQIARRNAS